jgi:hypothetical protein
MGSSFSHFQDRWCNRVISLCRCHAKFRGISLHSPYLGEDVRDHFAFPQLFQDDEAPRSPAQRDGVSWAEFRRSPARRPCGGLARLSTLRPPWRIAEDGGSHKPPGVYPPLEGAQARRRRMISSSLNSLPSVWLAALVSPCPPPCMRE